MGNETSQFQSQFYKLYNFIAVIDDPYFKQVKIYRKIKFSFNYIMIVENPVVWLRSPSQTVQISEYIKERLGLIRKHQNQVTSKLQYYHMLEDTAINCSTPLIKMYIQYYSYTLHDYLNSLRIKRFNLKISQLIFVIRSLAEALITLRKMKLIGFKLTLNSIFVSAEVGKVVINPIHFLYEEINIPNTNANLYQSNFLSTHPHINYENNSNIEQINHLQKRQLQNLIYIFVEMTRYLNIKELNQINHPYSILKGLAKVRQVLNVFKTEIEELDVQQFCQQDQSNYQLYDMVQREPNV